MDCYLFGILGLALIGGSFGTLSVTQEQHNVLKNVFSNEFSKKYENIVIERRNHYLIGIVLGLCISYYVITNVPILNTFTRSSIFVTITLGTALIFYMMMPKSDYVLNHLKTPEENKKWLYVYENMKSRYFMGFVLGMLAAIPLSNALCK